MWFDCVWPDGLAITIEQRIRVEEKDRRKKRERNLKIVAKGRALHASRTESIKSKNTHPWIHIWEKHISSADLSSSLTVMHTTERAERGLSRLSERVCGAAPDKWSRKRDVQSGVVCSGSRPGTFALVWPCVIWIISLEPVLLIKAWIRLFSRSNTINTDT